MAGAAACALGKSLAQRSFVGERAGNDGLSLRMHAVAMNTESEAMRAGCAGFHLALGEFNHLADARGPAVVADRRPRLGGGLPRRRLLTELFIGWHELREWLCNAYADITIGDIPNCGSGGCAEPFPAAARIPLGALEARDVLGNRGSHGK